MNNWDKISYISGSIFRFDTVTILKISSVHVKKWLNLYASSPMIHRLNQIISDYFITQKNKESFLLTNPGKLNQNFLRNFDYWKTHPSKFIFYIRSHWDRLNETVSSSLYLNPHWWILENSSINFYEISITGDYWKTDPSKFPERFLENSSVRVTPRNSLNVILNTKSD